MALLQRWCPPMVLHVCDQNRLDRTLRRGWLEYIASPETMPQWAIHNVNSIRKLERGRWDGDSRRGDTSAIFRPLFPDVEIVRSEKLPWGATMATTEPASPLASSARNLLLLLLTRHQFDEFSAVNPEEHCSYRPARFDLPVEDLYAPRRSV